LYLRPWLTVILLLLLIIIIILFFRKWGLGVWVGSIWFRTETGGGHL
jgi:hypothetical protein